MHLRPSLRNKDSGDCMLLLLVPDLLGIVIILLLLVLYYFIYLLSLGYGCDLYTVLGEQSVTQLSQSFLQLATPP